MPDAVARWRIVHGRGSTTVGLTQRDEQEAWEAALSRSGMPVALDGRGRPRTSFAVPLPVGLTAEAERLDVYLTEPVRVVDVRSALAASAPSDHPLVEVYDVWIGAPALAADVVALDYRLAVGPPPDAGRLEAAVGALLGAGRIERSRDKGGRSRTYDLRPLLLDLRATDDAGLWTRLRADPTLGVGRPDEVVAAMGAAVGSAIDLLGGSRERIWLADEWRRRPEAPGSGDGGAPPVHAGHDG
jgi:radical SAM-linked protein